MTTYFVSAVSGSDTNYGTVATAPFATLQAAANKVRAGDTVEVMNGTYTGWPGGNVLQITTSGTSSAPITFEAMPGQTPIIDSSGTWNGILVQASYITIKGFTVVGDAANYTLAQALALYSQSNPNVDGNGIFVSSPGGGQVPNHVTIENNTVYNEPGGGIGATGSDYLRIINNIVHDNAHWSGYGNSGISIAASVNSDTLAGVHSTISGNVSYNNTELVNYFFSSPSSITDGEGIILDTNTGYTGQILVQGNTAYGNSGPGIESFLTNNAVIDGNTVYSDLSNPAAAGQGEIFINSSSNNTITNNIGRIAIKVPGTMTAGVGKSTAIAGISLAESGATSGETFTVTIADIHGALSATGATGNGSTSLTITGSLGAVNAALATLSDTDGTPGPDTITLNATDSFSNSATQRTIAMTAIATSALPTITAPGTVTAGVGKPIAIAGISISEAGATSGETFTVTLTDTHGALSATGATGNGGTNLTITGSLSAVNTALATLSDTDGTPGSDTITLSATDSFGNSATQRTIAVTANGLPAITAPGTVTAGVGKSTAITGISLAESGITSGETFTVTLTDIHGALAATGATGNGGTSLTITGSLGTVNAELATLTDTNASTAADSISIQVSDSLGNSATPASIAVTVNAAPSITAPGAATVVQNQSTPISGIAIAESGNTAGETFTVTLSDLNGHLSATGAGVTGSNTASLTITGSLSAVNAGLATLTDNDASATADSITVQVTDSFANSATTASIAVTVSPASGNTYALTTGTDMVNAGSGNNRIIAKSNTLTSGDQITGRSGTNTLDLQGSGIFNLAAPAKLSYIQVITAREGQGATAQTVTLRAGLNATVNVVSDTAGDPSPGITIIGAANSDVINLGSGNDTVTLGAGETVNGGSGIDIYNVTGATIGKVTIKGGSGINTLMVNGGGSATMSTKISGINIAKLMAPTVLVANTTSGLQITGSSAGGDTITLGAPTQSVVAGGANERVKVTAANATASISGLGANSTLEITTDGTVTLNAATDVTTVKLDAASTLGLNGMAFIAAIGSGSGDTIRAGATYQTLTGGAGVDTLIGYSGGYDTFRDTAAGLNGDTIQGYGATDVIDVNDLAFAGAALSTAASGADTRVTLTSGANKSVFTLAGSWSSSGFHLASDGGQGTFLTHT